MRPTFEPFKVRLRRLREAKHLTCSTLALYAGVTEGAIRQMESGQTKHASLLTGVRIAEALGVTPAYLAFGESDGTDDPAVAGKPLVVPVDTTRRWDEVERRLARVERRLASEERE